MSAISTKFKAYVVQGIISDLSTQNPPAWQATTNYNVGDQVTNFGNTYVNSKAGQSGSLGPTSIGSNIDSGVTWIYVSPSKPNTGVNYNLYVALSGITNWSGSPPGETPDIEATSQQVKNESFALLRLSSSNARLGLQRNDWVTGTIYLQYDGLGELPQSGNGYYVTDASGNIFKCIDNDNGAASTVQPTIKTNDYAVYGDGYVWKFMGSVGADNTTFGIAPGSLPGFVPVTTAPTSGANPDQFNVQTHATIGAISTYATSTIVSHLTSPNTITAPLTSPDLTIASFDKLGNVITPALASGAAVTWTGNNLTRAYATAAGSDYGVNTYLIASPATSGVNIMYQATTLTSGGVTTVATVDPTLAFVNKAEIFVLGDGTGASVTGAYDGSNHLTLTVAAAGTGYTWAVVVIVPYPTGYSSVKVVWTVKAIMSPVQGHGSNLALELAANALLMSYDVSNTLSGYILPDFRYHQIALLSDVSPVSGSTDNALAFVGPANSNYSSGSLDKYNPSSGDLLYLDNITEIHHTTDAEERLKIAITF